MYSHQGYLLIVPILIRILVGKKGNFRKEVTQQHVRVSFLLPLGAKITHTVHQLLYILLTAQILGRAVLTHIIDDARLANNVSTNLVGILLRSICDKGRYKFAECLQLSHRTFIEVQAIRQRLTKHGPQTYIVPGGGSNDFSHCRISDTPCRIIDNTFESLFIIGIHYQTEVSDNIFDFLALIERQASINTVRHTAFAHGFLKDTALCIGTVEYRKIRVGIALFTPQFSYLIHHNIPFFHITVCLVHTNGLSLLLFREHFLAYLPLVLFYQAVGRADNGLGGTVILLQLEDLRIGIYFRKVENIVNIGTTEGVNTLCIIPHHTDMLMVLGKLQHNAVLCKIGILILIYQNVTELVLITRQHLGVVPEQQECVEQQIVEVHRICLPATLPISLVDVAKRRNLGCTVSFVSLLVVGIACRRNQMILGIRDTRLHHPRLVHFLIQPHFLDNGTYQAFTVCRIVNGKLRSEADIPGLDMQNAQEHGVKGSHPQMARPLRPHLTGYTLLHFARRLVGKGQCQNVPRLVAILQQISNLVGQHARLSRTGTGYHQ